MVPLTLAGRGPSSNASFPTGPDDRGTFTLWLGGREVGSEKFDIRTAGGQVEAKAEIHLRVEQDGRKIELNAFPDLVMDDQLDPLTYTWTQKGSQSFQVQVDFRASPATCHYVNVGGKEENRSFALQKDVVVLDDNVFHHFQFVVSRFARKAETKQTLKVFIPQEALPGDLTVEDQGWESIEIAGVTGKYRHLVLTTELARIDLWLDDQERLQRVFNSSAQFEALRKK